jgi:hypothetical protein
MSARTEDSEELLKALRLVPPGLADVFEDSDAEHGVEG